MAATKNGTTNIVLNEGTEASPKLITTVVSDINDATFIGYVAGTNNKVILLLKYIDTSAYWLKIPSDITVIFGSTTACVYLNNNAAGLWLEGGSQLIIDGGQCDVSVYFSIKKGTFKCTLVGNAKPVIKTLSGRNDWPTFDHINGSPANMIYKIDGLTILAGANSHHKFYSSNAASYVNNYEAMLINEYSGLATGLQIREGIVISDYATDIVSLAGDGVGGSSVNRMVRPSFLNQSGSVDIPVYPNTGTKIDVVDMKFKTGDWSGKLKAADSSQVGQWGTSQFRFFNTLAYTFMSGVTPIAGVKVGYVATAIIGTAPAPVYVTTTSSGTTSNECLRAAFTTALTVTPSNPNQKNGWAAYARSYDYDVSHNIYANQEPKQSVAETYQGTLNATVTASLAAAAAIAGIAFDKANTKITLTSAVTLDQLHDKIRWWLYQDAQMNLASFLSVSGQIINLGAWSVDGAQYLSIGAKLTSLSTTGTVTLASGLPAIAYTDSTGVHVRITGLDPQAFGTTWVLGWIKNTDYLAASSSVAPATWTGWNQASGTGNTTSITLEANTIYQLFIRCPGYNNGVVGPVLQIDTTSQSIVTMPTAADKDIYGVDLWPQSAAYAAQAANFTYSFVSQLVEYSNTTGVTEYVPFLAVYRALETLAKQPSLIYYMIKPVYVNGTKNGFTVPRNNPLLARMTAASAYGIVMQADVRYEDTQLPAYDRFRINASNSAGALINISPLASADLSSESVASIRSGLAVSTDIAVLQTTAAAIKAKTDTLVNADLTPVLDAVAASAAPTPTQNAAAVRTELAAELGRMDVAVSTRSKPSDVVNVNIVKVNNVTVTGTGEEGAEWGPAA